MNVGSGVNVAWPGPEGRPIGPSAQACETTVDSRVEPSNMNHTRVLQTAAVEPQGQCTKVSWGSVGHASVLIYGVDGAEK